MVNYFLMVSILSGNKDLIFLYSQYINPLSSMVGGFYMGKINRFLLFVLVSSIVHAQEGDQRLKAMEEAYTKGYELLYIDKVGSYNQFDKALNIAVSLNDYQSQLDILGLLTYANGHNDDLENYRLNLLRTEKILYTDSLKSSIEQINTYIDPFLLDKGNYYFKTKEYAKAKLSFLELHSKFGIIPHNKITSDNGRMLFSINNFLATIYKHEGKYELSEQYYLRNLDLVEKSSAFLDSKQSRTMNINQLLAQLHSQMGHYNKANTLLLQALETYKLLYAADKKFKNTLLTVYQKLTENYMLQDSVALASSYLKESGAFLDENDPFYKKHMILFGDINSVQDDPKLALDYYNEALTSFIEFRGIGPHQDIAEVHGKIAKSHLRNIEYKAGLAAIQNALNNAGQNISITALDQNPAPEKAFSKKQLLYLLDLKIQHLVLAYVQEGNTNYLDYAVKTISTITETFNLLKKEFDSKLDKQFLAETAYPIFHRMLAVTYDAYQNNPSSELLELALEISEKNKDFLLLEALRSANATQYANVPKEVVEREAQLRAGITHIEKNIFDTKNQKVNFSEELFKLKQEYYSFLDTVKVKYPKYHDLKYQSKDLDLKTIRANLLEDDGVLISFTASDKELYTIVLDDSQENFLKFPFNESDRKEVRDYYRIISRPSIVRANDEMATLGKSLFNKILKEPLKGFEGGNLTIIANGVLHYLPFDLLQENEQYLIQNKVIGYANSITSLLELKEKKSNQGKRLLAFAPSFEGKTIENNERNFGKLLYNTDEVDKISTFYETQVYSNANATLQNFVEQASNFNSIHLATHASANDEFPDFSYLAFTEDGKNDNTLFIKDLYNTNLNADMVVLSACQTGIGKLQKGQGMLSLSKGFYYAGAKSLVNTLWKINDKSTVKLMEYFYEGLSQGKSKTEALHNAKLKYLETTEDELLKHPYYWAAFVVSGDTTPISAKKNYWWIVIVGGSLLTFIVFYIKRRNRFKKVSLVS